MIRKIKNLGRLAGLDAGGFFRYVGGLPRYFRDARKYRKLHQESSKFPFHWSAAKPLTQDYHDSAGNARGHYFHQDLWAARAIFQQGPQAHVDVGSRVDGFVSHVLSFMPVTAVDVRSLDSHVEGLTFVQDDATLMRTFDDDSVESLSCLHAMEHFGLGRYGDPIDPNSCFEGMKSLARVLKPEGRLYFSVPSGCERLEFNAHRVFSPETILETFSDLELISFSAVTDDDEFIAKTSPETVNGAHFACGMYEFTKRAA